MGPLVSQTSSQDDLQKANEPTSGFVNAPELVSSIPCEPGPSLQYDQEDGSNNFCSSKNKETIAPLLITPSQKTESVGAPNILHVNNRNSLPLKIKIDWSKPVYLKQGNRYRRISRPAFRLFSLLQILACVQRGDIEIAKIMLSVIGTKGQCRTINARYQTEFWKLMIALNPSISEQLIGEAKNYLTDVTSLTLSSPLISLNTPKQTHSCDPISRTPKSPDTPQFTIPVDDKDKSVLLRTPDLEDEETKMLQNEINEVVRRTPALQDSSKRKTTLFDTMLPAIRESSLYKEMTTKTEKSVNNAKPLGNDLGGSTYLFAVVTPRKRLQNILDSKVAISPVRRSKRFLHGAPEKRQRLFECIDDIPDLASWAFIPNNIELPPRTNNSNKSTEKDDPDSEKLVQ